jgi:hypothetical protein
MDSTIGTRAIACTTLLVASVSSSAAAEPTLQDKGAAQALFDEGRAAMAADHVSEACKSFGASYDLDPSDGTLLNLALCHEKEGRTASAYAELGESVSRAIRDQRPEREKVAREHLASVTLRLSRLTVNVPSTSLAEGLVVTVDGSPLGRPAWGVATPFDPGAHVIEAKAPGKRPYTTTATLAPEHAAEQVEVPVLVDDPFALVPTPPLAHEPPASSDNPQRTLGWAAIGVGAAGVAIGSITGALAIAKWSGATSECPNAVCPSSADRAAFVGAGTLADVSTATYIAGGVGLAAGLVLLLTAPHAAPARGAIHVDPLVGAGTFGVHIWGKL